MSNDIAAATDIISRLHELRNKLQPPTRERVDELQAKAVAYVWGWQDALRNTGVERDTGDSCDFGNAYAVHMAELEVGLRPDGYAIQDAFRWWREGKRNPSEWHWALGR